MRVLLDTNAFYQLRGYYKNHKPAKELNLAKMCSDLETKKNEYFISFYTFCEIMTHDFSDKKRADCDEKRKDYLEFLTKYNILVLWIDRNDDANIKIFDISQYCSVDKPKFDKLKTYCLNQKKQIELDELKELYNMILVYTRLAYSFLAYCYSSKKNILQNYDFFMKICNQLPIQSDKILYEIIEEYESKKSIKTKFFAFIKFVIEEMLKEISLKDQEYKPLIEKERLSVESYKDNILKYLENISTRIKKHLKHENIIWNISNESNDSEFDLIEKMKIGYKNDLIKLNYPENYIKYFMFLIDKYFRNGNFDKNDFIDSYQFRYISENLYLLSTEKDIINILKAIPYNYNAIKIYLGEHK